MVPDAAIDFLRTGSVEPLLMSIKYSPKYRITLSLANLATLFLMIGCATCNWVSNDNLETVTPDTLAIPVAAADTLPVLMDTTDLNKFSFIKRDTVHASWLTTADYRFLYIGPVTDTIRVNHFLGIHPPPPPPSILADPQDASSQPRIDPIEKKYYRDWGEDPVWKNYRDANLNLVIDTSRTINSSYPVFIQNCDTDTTSVEYGRHLPLIMEAQDSTGNWRPIQEHFMYICGMGVGTIVLPPGRWHCSWHRFIPVIFLSVFAYVWMSQPLFPMPLKDKSITASLKASILPMANIKKRIKKRTPPNKLFGGSA